MVFNQQAARLFAGLSLWQQPGASPFESAPYTSGASFFSMILQTLLALALVCGLAYAIFRWVLPRLQVTRSAGSMVRIVDRVGLDARKNLYVIEVTGRWLLVASSESGVQLVSELDAQAAEELAQEIENARPNFKGKTGAARGAFAERLAQLMNKKR